MPNPPSPDHAAGTKPKRMLHCDNCGDLVGEGTRYRNEPVSCGEPECESAARDMERAADDEARERAREDGYDRYR